MADGHKFAGPQSSPRLSFVTVLHSHRPESPPFPLLPNRRPLERHLKAHQSIREVTLSPLAHLPTRLRGGLDFNVFLCICVCVGTLISRIGESLSTLICLWSYPASSPAFLRVCSPFINSAGPPSLKTHNSNSRVCTWASSLKGHCARDLLSPQLPIGPDLSLLPALLPTPPKSEQDLLTHRSDCPFPEGRREKNFGCLVNHCPTIEFIAQQGKDTWPSKSVTMSW